MSRAIAVGYPHHITQRGNYRQTVFTDAEDYAHYLELLVLYARRHDFQSGVADGVLSGLSFLDERISDWMAYLQESHDAEAQVSLLKSTRTGRPCGEHDFVAKLEENFGRRFATLPPGRPVSEKNPESEKEK